MLTYDIKKRVWELVLQLAEEIGIKIEHGVVSSDHVHIFANTPPHIKISEFVQKAKGRSFIKNTGRISYTKKEILEVDIYGGGIF